MITLRVDKSDTMSSDYSIFISFPYNEKILNIVRAFRDRAWHKETKEWEVPLSMLDNLLDIFSDYDIEVTGQYVDLTPKEEITDINFEFKTKPFEHQKEAFLFGLNHNKWLENIKSQINKSIKNQNNTINFTDINYNKEIFDILQKIAKPNSYRNNYEKKNNTEDIMDKLEKITDFNDIIGTVNSCSKYKRESLINKIHNNNSNNYNNNDIMENNSKNDNEININLSKNENNRITFNDNEKNRIDNDIIMEDIISSTQKVKLESDQMEKDANSLCTIVEQPSMEDMKKSMLSNIIPSNHFEEKNKTGNYVLDLNNNMSNISNTLTIKSANNNNNYKPLKLSESTITPKKDEENINKDINNNGYAINLAPQFSFNKAGQKKNDNIDSNNKGDSNSINLMNNKNEITFNFSSNKKILNDFSSNKKYESQKQNDIVTTPTLNPIHHKIDTNNNFINAITDTIYNLNQEKNDLSTNNNILNNNNENKIVNNNGIINNNKSKKNYVQELVLLSSTKKVNEIKNKTQKKEKEKEKEKYEDDFEEYEMSDSSKRFEEEEEEDDELNGKFIPNWALDEEYINKQLLKQNNNKDLVYKSFGNFVVEHLNLNMIFETHNQVFDFRNSTADWRGDDSWAQNSRKKIDDANDNDNNIFPNRKLQFV